MRKLYPNLEKSKLIDKELPPVGLLYYVRECKEEEKENYSVDKYAVEFNKYGRDNEGREKLLEEFANRDDFVCWALECKAIPYTDEQLQELSTYKYYQLAVIANTKLEFPDYIKEKLNENKK